MRCRVNIATESINPVAPQLVNHVIYDIDTLDKNTGIWSPATIIRRSPDINHCSTVDHALGQGGEVGDAVGEKSDYSEENYKIDFEIWMEYSKLQFMCENIKRS